jgi:hypothetical protein
MVIGANSGDGGVVQVSTGCGDDRLGCKDDAEALEVATADGAAPGLEGCDSVGLGGVDSREGSGMLRERSLGRTAVLSPAATGCRLFWPPGCRGKTWIKPPAMATTPTAIDSGISDRQPVPTRGHGMPPRRTARSFPVSADETRFHESSSFATRSLLHSQTKMEQVHLTLRNSELFETRHNGFHQTWWPAKEYISSKNVRHHETDAPRCHR